MREWTVHSRKQIKMRRCGLIVGLIALPGRCQTISESMAVIKPALAAIGAVLTLCQTASSFDQAWLFNEPMKGFESYRAMSGGCSWNNYLITRKALTVAAFNGWIGIPRRMFARLLEFFSGSGCFQRRIGRVIRRGCLGDLVDLLSPWRGSVSAAGLQCSRHCPAVFVLHSRWAFRLFFWHNPGLVGFLIRNIRTQAETMACNTGNKQADGTCFAFGNVFSVTSDLIDSTSPKRLDLVDDYSTKPACSEWSGGMHNTGIFDTKAAFSRPRREQAMPPYPVEFVDTARTCAWHRSQVRWPICRNARGCANAV